LGRDRRATKLGKGRTAVLPDRLRYSWHLNSRGREHALILELMPVEDSAWNEARVRVRVENLSESTSRVGIAVQMDLQAGGHDNAPVAAGGVLLTSETMLRGREIPAEWTAAAGCFSPDSMGGRLRGEGVTVPDVFLYGRWESHGALGMALYGYEGRAGRRVSDAALFLQWDEREVPAYGMREEAAAIGLRAAAIAPPVSSFGKRFIVNTETYDFRNEVGFFYLVSARDARVSISWTAQNIDRLVEYDTSIALAAGKVDTLVLPWRYVADTLVTRDLDSVDYVRQFIAVFDSDTPFGLVKGYKNDAGLCWPVERAAKRYVLPGLMFGGILMITTMEKEATISIVPRDVPAWFRFQPGGGFHAADSVSYFHLPARAKYHIELDTTLDGSWWYDPRMQINDGTGTVIESDSPIQIANHYGSCIPVNRTPARPNHRWHLYNNEWVPDEKRAGTEYVYVPYTKPWAQTNEDMLRIVAFNDSTLVYLGDSLHPRLLNMGDRIDTLAASPIVISSSRAVAVYQHATFWYYANPFDSVVNAGALTLHPASMWGKRYYGFIGLLRYPFVPYMRGNHDYRDYYRLRITARAGDLDSVFLNGARITPSQFTLVGGYAYYDTEMVHGPALVASGGPCLTMIYGWIYGWGWDIPFNDKFRGDAHVPPFR